MTGGFARIYDEGNDQICVLKTHADGGPKDFGLKLKEFAEKAEHNGMNCLAASIVAYFKTNVCDIYLYPPSDDMIEGVNYDSLYEYHVRYKDGRVKVEWFYLGSDKVLMD